MDVIRMKYFIPFYNNHCSYDLFVIIMANKCHYIHSVDDAGHKKRETMNNCKKKDDIIFRYLRAGFAQARYDGEL